MEPISIDDFHKVEIRVGEIVSAEPIEGSDKLLKLKVNFGFSIETGKAEERQVLSGIAKHVGDPAGLVGKRVPFVTNLVPRTMMGLESQAMLVATGGDGETPFALFETSAPAGAAVH